MWGERVGEKSEQRAVSAVGQEGFAEAVVPGLKTRPENGRKFGRPLGVTCGSHFTPKDSFVLESSGVYCWPGFLAFIAVHG